MSHSLQRTRACNRLLKLVHTLGFLCVLDFIGQLHVPYIGLVLIVVVYECLHLQNIDTCDPIF